VKLSDIEPRFVCTACGKRGVDVRPDFAWDKPGMLTRGFLTGQETGRAAAAVPGDRRQPRFSSVTKPFSQGDETTLKRRALTGPLAVGW
jgi:hypothetical protein